MEFKEKIVFYETLQKALQEILFGKCYPIHYEQPDKEQRDEKGTYQVFVQIFGRDLES